ncbi:MAG: hypothetical protein IJW08_06085 [Lentisphaeria bacterium]|nr:hypothetical protein [Lentisphaeria bacterium]
MRNVNPDKDVRLQALPQEILSELNKTEKPLVLKQNIVEKNKIHSDLSESDIINILGNAIYNCDLIIQPNPKEKPDYFMLVSRGEINKQALIEISENKGQYEIVNYHYIGNRQLKQKISRAEKQNGMIRKINRDGLPKTIITQTGAAGRFSALPADGINISQTAENANHIRSVFKITASNYNDIKLEQPRVLQPSKTALHKGGSATMTISNFIDNIPQFSENASADLSHKSDGLRFSIIGERGAASSRFENLPYYNSIC